MTRTVSAHRAWDWGVLARGRSADHHSGALVIWFVRNYMAKGLPWAGSEEAKIMDLFLVALDRAYGNFLHRQFLLLNGSMERWEYFVPRFRRGLEFCALKPPARPVCSFRCLVRRSSSSPAFGLVWSEPCGGLLPCPPYLPPSGVFRWV